MDYGPCDMETGGIFFVPAGNPGILFFRYICTVGGGGGGGKAMGLPRTADSEINHLKNLPLQMVN
jgi:hypothetical protein